MRLSLPIVVFLAALWAAQGVLACPEPIVTWAPNPVCVGCESVLTLTHTELPGYKVTKGPWVEPPIEIKATPGKQPLAAGKVEGHKKIKWSAPGYCSVVVISKLDWVRTADGATGRSTNTSVTPFTVARMGTFTLTDASDGNNRKEDTSDKDNDPDQKHNTLYLAEDIDGQADVLINLTWTPADADVGQIFTWEIEDGSDWSPASGDFSAGQVESVWTNPDPGGVVDREFKIVVRCNCSSDGDNCKKCKQQRMLNITVLKVEIKDSDGISPPKIKICITSSQFGYAAVVSPNTVSGTYAWTAGSSLLLDAIDTQVAVAYAADNAGTANVNVGFTINGVKFVAPQQAVAVVNPTEEITTEYKWNGTFAMFIMQIVPTDAWYGNVEVKEYDNGLNDTCWFLNSDIDKWEHLDGTTWIVRSSGEYGEDHIGWYPDAILYYRLMSRYGGAYGTQIMKVMCTDTGNYQYTQHPVAAEIVNDLTISSTRDGITQTTEYRSW